MTEKIFPLNDQPALPIVIAGPCTAESEEILHVVAEPMSRLAQELGFTYIFKASFDKANRTSVDSYRGPGLEKAAEWFSTVKDRYGCLLTTDIHETHQAEPAAEVCDVLQIPAFLCRQTDLLVAAVGTKKAVSVKKGQFLAPESCQHIVSKVKHVAEVKGISPNVALIERGSCFGYGNLVVDMRGLKAMAKMGAPVIFDVTHSTQQPSSDKTTGGLRHCAPLLARAAAATGYLSGVFIEVHPDPVQAKSDAATQLSLAQAEKLLRQIVPLINDAASYSRIDADFD